MRIRVPHRPVHFGLFFLLAFLCYEGHQFVRHFVGAALCGGFGSMTFTVATTRQPCSFPTLLTISGPVFTLALEWIGALLLRSRKAALFAYALIFGSFAHVRFIQTLTGRGDELILAQQWFGVTNRAIVAAVVFLLGLPPVMIAFHAIANRRRTRVFIISWLLPLPLLFVMLVGDKLIFGGGGNGIQGVSYLGIAPVVLVTDLITAVLFIWVGLPYLRPQEDALA